MRMGGGPQQFGVDAEQVPALLRELARGRPRLPRLPHLRRLAEPQRRDPLRGAAQDRRAGRCGSPTTSPAPVRYLNLGGGFGIPYFEKDEPLDLAADRRQPRRSCSPTRSAPNLPDARVVIELGRYIVGECGVYVTRVVDRKESRGKTFLVVDGGLHHQLAASGNFGQVIRRNYPVAIGNRTGDDADRDGHRRRLPVHAARPARRRGRRCRAADVGDLVVVFQAGAYGLTASPTAFLSHPAPAEVLV